MALKQGIKPVLLTVIVLAIVTWAGLCAVLYALQNSLIFQPTNQLVTSPDAIGLAYEDVSMRSSNDTHLHGWFVPVENSRGVVLFLHGNAGNISHRLKTLEILHRLGLSTLIIDYQGYGESQGEPSEQATYADAETAWNYLTMERGIAPQKIIIFGRSLGGAVAAWLSARVEPAGIILESTFTSLRVLAKKYYPYIPVDLLLHSDYPALEYINNIQSPLLIIHSPEDELVPFSHAEQLHRAARKSSELKKISGDHNEGFLLSGNDYINLLKNFISRNLN